MVDAVGRVPVLDLDGDRVADNAPAKRTHSDASFSSLLSVPTVEALATNQVLTRFYAEVLAARVADLAHLEGGVHLHVNLVLFTGHLDPLTVVECHVFTRVDVFGLAERESVAPVGSAIDQRLVERLGRREGLQDVPVRVDKPDRPQPRPRDAQAIAVASGLVRQRLKQFLDLFVRHPRLVPGVLLGEYAPCVEDPFPRLEQLGEDIEFPPGDLAVVAQINRTA
mmetsp:Transcript_11512/g.29482  ORF Transcript_11512/g.29482 Transcript_11512/m.29482 type:complete len:224 (-) Transcript_11512:622-1293(-)